MSQGSSELCLTRSRAAPGVRIPMLIVLALVATLAALITTASPSGAATTDRYRYDSPPFSLRCDFADGETAVAVFDPAVAPGYGYDDSANLARTSAWLVRASFAPQTPGSDCSLPVFMPGGNTPETSAHIVAALRSQPA